MTYLHPLRTVENEIVGEAKRIQNAEELSAIIDTLTDETNDYQHRYRAYLIYFSYNRRMKNVEKCIELYSTYKDIFKDEFLFIHFYAIVIKAKETKSYIEESINLARKCVASEHRHSGALHNLAGSLSLYVSLIKLDEDTKKELLVEALEKVNEAINLEPDYAKFYATRSMIKAGLKSYESAENDIATAIEMEDSSSNDYSIRITEYLSIKSELKFKQGIELSIIQSKEEIEKALRKSEAEIELISQEARKSNLEVLSFFIAVISFIIGGLTIQKDMLVDDAVKIILVLAGSLIITISGFCLLFDSKNKMQRFSLSLAVALFLFVLARFSDALFFG